ncbi:TPA: CBASS cGAMP synthase [Neisseria subflava]
MNSSNNNIHLVFAKREKGFRYKIRPSQTDFNDLNEAKKSVRSYLKTAIKEYLEAEGIKISPKFRVQGSWAYGTCNAPAKSGQEIDVDYGIYLPVSAFDGFDATTQSEQAKTYFEKIESLLQDLCEEKKWGLDNTKPSCIRLKIKSNAHIDIPLYAVPDSMFDALQEKHELICDSVSKFESAKGIQLHWYNQDYDMNIQFAEESLQDKDIQTIHMAKRDGCWQSSDCEIIRQWFSDKLKAQSSDNGQQLRNICRYLKAWRDWVFDEKGAPSSILLMIIACKYYKYEEGRDDLALLHILGNLPECLNSNVYEEIQDHESEDFNRMSCEERRKAKIRADDLYKNFSVCLKHSDKTTILSLLTKQLGDRVPKDDSLIEISSDPFKGTPLIQTSVTPQMPLRQG